MRRIREKYLLILLFPAFISGKSTAQSNDAQLWTSLTVEKKLSQTISVNFSEELRLCNNISEIDQFFSDAGIDYKISKPWHISANYRFTNKMQINNTFSKRHRYYFDLSYRNKINNLSFNIRTRFQSQYADVSSSETGKIPEYYSRNKLTLKLDLNKKYTPYISAEMFFQLNNPEGNNIDNMRYTAGIEYEFNKKSSLDIFYMIQQEYNVTNPETDFVIGVGYGFKL
ncbi:MAG: DUF2490 domain-containing protein [Bacteroidales bacterium]|nr:DUF2490 domain-containing protein [Bacteroidales bacterium]